MKSSQVSPIGQYEYIRYEHPAEALKPYDDRFPDVARRVIQMNKERMRDAEVEHVGSTAIPGCAGKGVIDLMVLYDPGELEVAKAAVDSLGFQRHDKPGAHPKARPVRIGTMEHGGVVFRVHVHLIAKVSPEVVEQRRFRDRLRADSTLVDGYVTRKRAVLAAGVTDGNDYNLRKDGFIRRVLETGGIDERPGLRPGVDERGGIKRTTRYSGEGWVTVG